MLPPASFHADFISNSAEVQRWKVSAEHVSESFCSSTRISSIADDASETTWTLSSPVFEKPGLLTFFKKNLSLSLYSLSLPLPLSPSPSLSMHECFHVSHVIKSRKNVERCGSLICPLSARRNPVSCKRGQKSISSHRPRKESLRNACLYMLAS